MATSPWTAERSVSESLARELIEGQFPALAPARLEPLGEGWDNTAFRVNQAYVFRFPRREVAVELLATECRLLPAIAPQLPLSVPLPTFVGQPNQRFPWPFAGYPMLPGQTACALALDAEARGQMAAPLGRFLAALHAMPADEAARLGARPDALHRLDARRRTEPILQRLHEIAGLGLIGGLSPWEDIIHAAAECTPRSGMLVHGDLYARHLLVDQRQRLSGVIDWGDVHLGDPAVDLSIAYSFLPPAARESFQAEYGPVDESTLRLARFKALLTAVMIVVYGHAIGDEDLKREGLLTLGYLQEDAR